MAENVTAEDLLEKAKKEAELPDSNFNPEIDTPITHTKKEPAPKAAAPSTSTPTKPKHNPHMVAMAIDLGLSQEDVDASDPEQLAFAVRAAQKVSMRRAQETKHETTKETEKQEEPKDELDWGLDEDGTTPFKDILAKNLRSVIEDQHKRIVQLETALNQVVSHLRGQVERSNASKADEIFGKYAKFFGNGTYETIDRDSMEYRRRIKVLEEAARLAGKGASREAVFSKIPEAMAFFGLNVKDVFEPTKDPLQDIGKKANGSRISEDSWRDAALQSPTERTSKEPKGDSRAIKAVGQKLREFSATDEDFDAIGNEEAGLPD